MAASAKQVDRLASKSLICDPVRSPTRWRYPISGAPYVSTWFTGWENYAGDSAILLIHVPTGGTTWVTVPTHPPSYFNPRASRGHDYIVEKIRKEGIVFQSTCPRGARPGYPRPPASPLISIHVPAGGTTHMFLPMYSTGIKNLFLFS
ncbi:MAG: hypothetical protein ALMCE001_02270 [Methanocorpusculum sp. MCE]|nr:MAG: hypothetical protein ALMCE001_02270 [Methanocorpusculum sp. MCE]